MVVVVVVVVPVVVPWTISQSQGPFDHICDIAVSEMLESNKTRHFDEPLHLILAQRPKYLDAKTYKNLNYLSFGNMEWSCRKYL